MNDSNDYTSNGVSSAHLNSAHESSSNNNNRPIPTPKIRTESNINQELVHIPSDSDINTIHTANNVH